jgi:hypothetical protein
MSDISTIYDALLALIPTILTTHEELNNPYLLEDTSDIDMEKGWTLGFGPGENTQRLLGAQITYNRSFILTITRRSFGHLRDKALRITTEKLLFEDQKILINGIEKYTNASIENIIFVGDNGLEFLNGDRFGILLIQNNVSVEYFEDIT